MIGKRKLPLKNEASETKHLRMGGWKRHTKQPADNRKRRAPKILIGLVRDTVEIDRPDFLAIRIDGNIQLREPLDDPGSLRVDLLNERVDETAESTDGRVHDQVLTLIANLLMESIPFMLAD